MGLFDGTWGAVTAPEGDAVPASVLDPYKSGAGVNLDGLSPVFQEKLNDALTNMPPNLRATIKINSGFRPPQEQAAILARHLRANGIPVNQETLSRGLPGTVAGVVFDANGNLVGSKSMHARGAAVDVDGSPEAIKWLHANSGRYGFENPLNLRSSDPNHFQLPRGTVPLDPNQPQIAQDTPFAASQATQPTLPFSSRLLAAIQNMRSDQSPSAPPAAPNQGTPQAEPTTQQKLQGVARAMQNNNKLPQLAPVEMPAAPQLSPITFQRNALFGQ